MRAAFVTVALLASCLHARADYPVLCSAFSQRGDVAMADIAAQKLTLQISPKIGAPISLLSPMREDGLLGCRIFFDKSDRYVAVGVAHMGLTSGPLRMVVVDLEKHSFVGDFSVSNRASGAGPKSVGFFLDTPDIVVFEAMSPEHATNQFSTTLYSVKGVQLAAPTTHSVPADALRIGNVAFADAAHNRLWFKSSPNFCPLRSVPLVGGEENDARVEGKGAKAACDVEQAIAYPDETSLITATTREPNDLITRVDFATQTIDQIPLPETGRKSYTSLQAGMLSADGRVFSVFRELLTNSPLGNVRSGGVEVDIIEVSPLKYKGKVNLKPGADPASISLDHRNGWVSVLSFENGGWKMERLRVQ